MELDLVSLMVLHIRWRIFLGCLTTPCCELQCLRACLTKLCYFTRHMFVVLVRCCLIDWSLDLYRSCWGTSNGLFCVAQGDWPVFIYSVWMARRGDPEADIHDVDELLLLSSSHLYKRRRRPLKRQYTQLTKIGKLHRYCCKQTICLSSLTVTCMHQDWTYIMDHH